MRLPLLLSLLAVPVASGVVLGSCTRPPTSAPVVLSPTRPAQTMAAPTSARQQRVNGAVALIESEGAKGDAHFKRIGELLVPDWEKPPKGVARPDYFEMRRPLRRARLDWGAAVLFVSEKHLGPFGRSLELFVVELGKHDARALGISPASYAAIEAELPKLRANAAAVAGGIETMKQNESEAERARIEQKEKRKRDGIKSPADSRRQTL